MPANNREDPRQSGAVHQFVKPVRAGDDPNDPNAADPFNMFAPMMASVGTVMKMRWLCWAALFTCLMSLSGKRSAGFSWTQFVMAIIMSLAGIAVGILQEMNPAALGGAAAAGGAAEEAAATAAPTAAPVVTMEDSDF
jgi:hypothetical protein